MEAAVGKTLLGWCVKWVISTGCAFVGCSSWVGWCWDDLPPSQFGGRNLPFELLWYTCTCTSLLDVTATLYMYCADIGAEMHEREERERRREREGGGRESLAGPHWYFIAHNILRTMGWMNSDEIGLLTNCTSAIVYNYRYKWHWSCRKCLNSKWDLYG